MPPTDRTSTWTRRLSILYAVLRRGHITTSAAARHGSTDRRVALEDLKALGRHGVPLHQNGKGRDVRWVVDEAWRASGLGLDLPTRLALLFGRELVSGIMHETRFAQAIETLETTLANLSPELDSVPKDLPRRFHVVHEPDKDYGKHGDTLETLVAAILGNYRVALTYQTRSGDLRTYPAAAPYSLLLYKRTVYLVCESRDKIRTLPVEGFTEVRPIPDATFDYPRPSEYSPEGLLADVFGLIRHDDPPATVRLRFHKDVAPLVTPRRWHPSQTLTPTPDGGCELTMHATGIELVSFALSWGNKVEVLEPAWLRAKVIAELRAAVAQYDAPQRPDRTP
jgi:predicted DNA-binding transcriptional regulator YafY